MMMILLLVCLKILKENTNGQDFLKDNSAEYKCAESVYYSINEYRTMLKPA